jgi:shikimate kinase
MSTPKDKIPAQQPTGDPKVDAAEQGVITNTEESNKIVNTGGAVADMDGMETTLSNSEPSTVLNADPDIIKSEDGDTGEQPVVN